MTSIQTWLKHIVKRLARVSETPSLDAQVLLAHIIGRSRSWVLAHQEVALTTDQASILEEALARLEDGEPLPYIIGRWEFYGLDFIVTPATLIPRPETELLVGEALAWLEDSPGRRQGLDVGTGTGCIPIALATHVLDLSFLASDFSFQALKVAQLNVRRYALAERICLVQADLAPPVNSVFDLVCANLPYIPSKKLASLRVAQYEPNLALDGGLDGMDLIRKILVSTAGFLAPGGLFLLEIEAFQGSEVEALASQTFPGADVQLMVDLAGNDRLVKIRNI